jgi:hypothetical protein
MASTTTGTETINVALVDPYTTTTGGGYTGPSTPVHTGGSIHGGPGQPHSGGGGSGGGGGGGGPPGPSWPSQNPNSLPQPPPNNVQGTSFDKIRLAAPSTYTGKPGDVESFLTQLQLHFLTWSPAARTPDNQVAFALSHINGGTADKWKQAYLNNAFKAHPTISGAQRGLGTWPEFIAAFKQAFQTKDQLQEAQMKLRALRQGNSTVDEYTVEFNLLKEQTGMEDKNKYMIEQYIRGLDPSIASQIFNTTKLPSTLDEWQLTARNIDRNRRRGKELASAFKHGLGLNKPLGNSNNNTNTPDPNAMDVDRLTPEERTKAFRDGLCLICLNKGHIAKECPQRKKHFNRNRSQRQGNSNQRNWKRFNTNNPRRLNATDTKEEEPTSTKEEVATPATPDTDSKEYRANRIMLIRSIFSEMNDADRDEMFDALDEDEKEEEDFISGA